MRASPTQEGKGKAGQAARTHNVTIRGRGRGRGMGQGCGTHGGVVNHHMIAAILCKERHVFVLVAKATHLASMSRRKRPALAVGHRGRCATEPYGRHSSATEGGGKAIGHASG